MSAPTFASDSLQDMVAVGAVGPDRARLWVRAAEPGPLRVTLRAVDEASAAALEGEVRPPAEAAERDGTLVVRLPHDLAPTATLRPATRYAYRVERAGAALAAGCFTTAPSRPEETPERFAIGLMSCHQPFDDQGRVLPAAEGMLRAAREALTQHEARLVLSVGDQVYADEPPALSLRDRRHFAAVAPSGRGDLLECTAEEVRRLYHERYRRFWALPAWRKLHAAFPCYPMLDDHEVIDDWGSRPEHAEDAWRRVAEGALAAYLDYQGARVRDDRPSPERGFHYEVDYGRLALFVLDVRAARRPGPEGGQLLGPEQLAALEQFLAAREDAEALCLVTPVPVIHLPRWAIPLGEVLGGSFADRWSGRAFREERDAFLRLLHDHQLRRPRQRVVLLSGDIHIGCAHEARWADGPRFHQLVSSGITHEAGGFTAFASTHSIAHTRALATSDGALVARVRRVPGDGAGQANPVRGRNLGLVEVEAPRDGPLRLRFLLYGHEGERPLLRYRSGWL